MSRPYYERCGVSLYQGDCRDILPTVRKVDLVLTDPPYGLKYNREAAPQEKHAPSHRNQVASVAGDDFFDPTPLLSLGRGRILWGANCYASRLPDCKTWIGWDKVTRNGLRLRIAEMELAWADCIRRPVMFRHLWSGAYRASERKNFVHPTQKPVALMEFCMQLPGVPSGLVLDPYCGSGPVLAAALNLGRPAIGIEVEERYCEIAARRLEALTLPSSAGQSAAPTHPDSASTEGEPH